MHHKAQSAQGPDAAHAPLRRDAASKKARAMESEKAQIQLLREAVASKQSKRSNFFQHLIKKEEQGEPLLVRLFFASPPHLTLFQTFYSLSNVLILFSQEDDSPIGINSTTAIASTPAEPYSPPHSPPPPSSPPAGLRSPLPEDMEDEERFLRTLGWVPDEEDPVPMLAEEEIADVRVKIILSKVHSSPSPSPLLTHYYSFIIHLLFI